MTSPNANPTPITPPRVPLIDERTGLIDRAWYLFFYNLFTSSQDINDLRLAPVAQAYDQAIAAVEQQVGTLPSAAQLAELVKEVEALQLLPPPRGFKRSRYGQFYDTTTQSISSANTAQAVTFNTSNISNGVYIGSPTSRIIVDTEGLYNFQASMQFDCTGGANREVWVWLRLNGTDIADSAFYLNIQNANSEVLQAFNLFVDMKANDYVEVMWEVGNTAARLATFAATGVHPAVPSIILTVSNNIEGIES
jgi:hypothetical protein